MSNKQNGYAGLKNVHSATSELNAMAFVIEQILTRKHHATLVRVVAVTNTGNLAAVGFVDVLPLVNNLDGNGNPIPHSILHRIPYHRVQGGTDAIILDPKIQDIGIAIFCDRDISSVKGNRAASNPGSMRRSDMADGLYIGGFLNGVPTQFVQFSASGINVVSPTKITLVAPLVEIDASTSFTVVAPASSFSGTVLISGLLTFVAGCIGSTLSGAAAVFTGIFNVSGQISCNGKRVDDTHTHHENGAGANTNPPN